MLALAPMPGVADHQPSANASFMVTPLEARRSSRGVDHIASPRSCRSTRSWPDGTTVTSDSAFEAVDPDSQRFDDFDDDEDEDQEGEEEEEMIEADVDVVGNHFEAMNSASEALNSCQQAQSRLQKARSAEICRWAERCASAFLPKLTAESIVRARACFNLELSARKAEAELQQLEARSRQANGEASGSTCQLDRDILERRQFYCELEGNLEEALRAAAHSSWSPALRYLEEEYEHQQKLLQFDEAMQASVRETTIAKMRYETALTGLKDLSAAVHRSRSRRPTGGAREIAAMDDVCQELQH